MPKPSPDLSWQEDFARECQRTSGVTLSFGPVAKGGYYTLTVVSATTKAPYETRMRRSEVIENTARLRERPDHDAEASAGIETAT